MRSVFILIFVALSLFEAGCNRDVSILDLPIRSTTGKLILSISDSPAGVAEVIARLSRDGYESRVLQLTIADTGRNASGSYSSVPVGLWHLAVEALSDSGTLQYAGETDVDVIPGQVNSVTLELSQPPTRVIALRKGWNMVSIPLNVVDSGKRTLFPVSSSPAFMYEKSYVAKETLRIGTGYWIRVSSPATARIVGLDFSKLEIGVQEGWNLIGTLSRSISTASITSNPAGMVTSRFFKFEIGYQAADSLEAGKAYWVKVNRAGRLTLSCLDPGTPSGRIQIVEGAEIPPVPPSEISSGTTGDLPRTFRFNSSAITGDHMPGANSSTLKLYKVFWN
ncbi:MAG: hypothetical protein E6K56_07440 [Ignavibacteria bacterium]|nr:MAG: hypothetical protein E6K56_07440 [Ignavibacteria bacterium]